MTLTQETVTSEERQRRAQSIASIRHSQRMEGGDVTPFAAGLFDRYSSGELTLDEVGEALKKHHGIKS